MKDEMIMEMETEMDQETGLMEYEDTGYEGGGKKLVAGVAILAGVAAIGGFAYHKCKDKLEERKIEKLRKKGYVVFREEDCEVHEVEVDDVEAEEVSE